MQFVQLLKLVSLKRSSFSLEALPFLPLNPSISSPKNLQKATLTKIEFDLQNPHRRSTLELLTSAIFYKKKNLFFDDDMFLEENNLFCLKIWVYFFFFFKFFLII